MTTIIAISRDTTGKVLLLHKDVETAKGSWTLSYSKLFKPEFIENRDNGMATSVEVRSAVGVPIGTIQEMPVYDKVEHL